MGGFTRSKSVKNSKAKVQFLVEEPGVTKNDNLQSSKPSHEVENIVDDAKLDNLGAFYMRSGMNDETIFDGLHSNFDVDLDPNSMFIVELPVSQHNRKDVIDAKMKKMNNLETYGTFEEVEEKNVEEGANVIGSRWVVTKKERQDGQKEDIKARLVAQGFQESNKPQSDAPAAHHESFKLFLAVAAIK